MIGVYYIFNIIFVSISLASTVGILSLHHRGCNKTKVPKFFKILLFIRSNDSELYSESGDGRTDGWTDGTNVSSETSQLRKSYTKKFHFKEKEKKKLSNSDYFLHLSKSFDLNCNYLAELKDLRSKCEKYEKMEGLFINQQNNKRFKKLCEKISNWSKQVEKDRLQLKCTEKIIMEWRQVARRLGKTKFIFLKFILDNRYCING